MLTMPVGDLIDSLEAEHRELLPQMEQAAKVAGSGPAELAGALEDVSQLLASPLEEHIRQEDDVLFPAYAEETGGEGLVGIFREEHQEILQLRDQIFTLRQAGGDTQRLATAVVRLAELLDSHMNREENMLFPSARQALS